MFSWQLQTVAKIFAFSEKLANKLTFVIHLLWQHILTVRVKILHSFSKGRKMRVARISRNILTSFLEFFPVLDVDYHRVDRVLGFFFSRLNWDPATPSPAGQWAPPGSGGGDILACGRESGGSQFGRGDRHCGTL